MRYYVTEPTYTIAAFYRFMPLTQLDRLQKHIRHAATSLCIKGTIIFGPEGVNGTIAGPKQSIVTFKQLLASKLETDQIEYKYSASSHNPFLRLKIKLKREIVTIGIDTVDPQCIVGEYVKPNEWNQLITSPDVLLIDTRNDYEYAIGTFKGAINPNTQTFREFPNYIKTNISDRKKDKLALFCTGGIRCEKATSYLKTLDFEQVYHLEGGILKYLEEIPESESLWQGECFVFDNRVAVNHRLEPGSYDQCYACRMPITQADKHHPHYLHGVSCPNCFHTKSHQDKQRYKQRQRQCELAKQRHEQHLGS
tara:strand:+ start:153 stop:1079 length:927 start_codon:yes stop_codon:yes gene_type:complete